MTEGFLNLDRLPVSRDTREDFQRVHDGLAESMPTYFALCTKGEFFNREFPLCHPLEFASLRKAKMTCEKSQNVLKSRWIVAGRVLMSRDYC